MTTQDKLSVVFTIMLAATFITAAPVISRKTTTTFKNPRVHKAAKVAAPLTLILLGVQVGISIGAKNWYSVVQGITSILVWICIYIDAYRPRVSAVPRRVHSDRGVTRQVDTPR